MATIANLAKGSIIPNIRSSCREARIAANIEIKDEAIIALFKSPLFRSTYERLSHAHGVQQFPLQFTSTLDEVNFIAILSLLNFGHWVRASLKKAVGRGAYDSIRALMLGLYISSIGDEDLLGAQGMKTISNARVAELMQLTNYIHVETAHPTIPGLTVGNLGGDLFELVKSITSVLNETGSILVDRKCPNLGTFVLDALKRADENGSVDPEQVLYEIIQTFPGFQDVGYYQGKPIYVFKKALFLLNALVERFGTGHTEPSIPIANTSTLPIYSDNVIPSMLIHLGILELSATNLPNLRTAFGRLTVTENLETVIDRQEGERKQSNVNSIECDEGPALSGEEAYVLRAAALDACEIIVQRAKELNTEQWQTPSVTLTLPELDAWLWSVAKEGRLRTDLVRFRQTELPCIMY